MQKEFSYKDMQRQMSEGVCPICTSMQKKTLNKLNALSYAHLTDVEFRKNYIQSDGFCHHHTELFFQHSDILAHAVLFEHLFKVKLKRASNHKNVQKKRAKTCFLCQQEKTAETLLIGIFIKGLNDKAFLNDYKEKALCCTKHFDDILNHKKTKAHQDFKETTLKKYQRMHHHLAEIKRKNDFKYADERLSQAEIKASKQARAIINYPFDHL